MFWSNLCVAIVLSDTFYQKWELEKVTWACWGGGVSNSPFFWEPYPQLMVLILTSFANFLHTLVIVLAQTQHFYCNSESKHTIKLSTVVMF